MPSKTTKTLMTLLCGASLVLSAAGCSSGGSDSAGDGDTHASTSAPKTDSGSHNDEMANHFCTEDANFPAKIDDYGDISAVPLVTEDTKKVADGPSAKLVKNTFLLYFNLQPSATQKISKDSVTTDDVTAVYRSADKTCHDLEVASVKPADKFAGGMQIWVVKVKGDAPMNEGDILGFTIQMPDSSPESEIGVGARRMYGLNSGINEMYWK